MSPSNSDPKHFNVSVAQGAPPGSLIHIGPQREHPVSVQLITYSPEHIQTTLQVDPVDIRSHIPEGHIAWVNVDGVHDTRIVKLIGDQFGLHPLVLEDIVNTQERPKIENFTDYLYFVMNMTELNVAKGLTIEQVSIVLGDNFILSFQEDPDDIFDPIRKRMAIPGSFVRKSGADYLAYLLLDAVVDRFFLILETFGEKIDVLEGGMIEGAEKENLQEIYDLKRELINIRRAVWPMREVVGNLQRIEHPLISEELKVFLRDFYDHILRIIDSVETYRDTLAGLVDLYLSNSSIRMNEIMKVLTVISTIFIPLTFITGFYGMNFDFMPELHSEWSYPVVVGLMIGMVVGQLIYFKRKKWL